MFKFNYSKYNPGAYFQRGGGGGLRGGLIHGRSFPFQISVPKCPGAYTRWGLLSKFDGISIIKGLLASSPDHVLTLL